MPESRLVYSTANANQSCPRCGKTLRKCQCQEQKPRLPSDGVVRISRETKGRKGKGVCLISGLPLEGAELTRLAKELKALCGTGGTIKDGIIEIQGDHRTALLAALEKRFEKVKLAGA
ncbi:MAG: stress response translation initiation inhibitor YciH [Gammaproteobacteria bacterium]|jgi:translation initiation factor 1|nr:stress response translation initiation inhibitor YciH [Gammaproteobacteria bacterium]